MPVALHHRKLACRLDDGTELRLVSYVPGGSVYLQNVGENDASVIEVPPQFLSAVATGMTSIAAENAASAAVIGSAP